MIATRLSKCLLITVITVLSIFSYNLRAYAASINATSCSASDVQTAVNSASSGDIVQIPAGNCTWATGITINNAITVQGAGQGVTTITTTHNNLISITCPSSGTTRLTAMTIDMSGDTGEGTIVVGGTNRASAFRIDHLTIYEPRGQYPIVSYVWGLIDHVTFIYSGASQISMIGTSRAGYDVSHAWGWDDQTNDPGTANALYVEDCTFTGTATAGSNNWPVIDCDTAGKYVFRHNTVTNGFIGMHDSCTGHRACFSWEIYNNTISKAGSNEDKGVTMRGGTGVVFNNTFTGNFNTALGLQNYRSGAQTYTQCGGDYGVFASWCNSTVKKVCTTGIRPCTIDSDCTSHGDGTCSKTLDGTGGAYGNWPCRDQIGIGTNQTSHPAIFWGNTLNGSATHPTVVDWPETQHPLPSDDIQANRDFCEPSCSGSTCNSTCSSVTLNYTAYTYPHPLVSGSAMQPSPPGNLH